MPQDLRQLSKRPNFPKRAVITAGMPYGNKSLHFGHVGGVFVPADFFARFLRDRIGKENVLFVSGTDCFGSPIMEGYRKKVDEEAYNKSIDDYISQNHAAQKAALDKYDISLDLFAGSALGDARQIHAELSQEILQRLYERGYLTKRTTLQFFDTAAQQFLNGRQVIGRCPVKGCKSEKAYADECDLGHQFDPEELICPVSQLTNTTPELRPVDNWYFDLPTFEDELKDLMDVWDQDPQVRPLVTRTIRESLAEPLIYIQNSYREAFAAIKERLPEHTVLESEAQQQSFVIAFKNWQDRDKARTILSEKQIRFRTGKCLLPFRITGNISWGVKAPDLDGSAAQNGQELTIWVWPESLWAPISFTKTALAQDSVQQTAGKIGDSQKSPRFSSHDWKDWWASQDAKVYQFIGQDNIYFYCAAQPALWSALDWNLSADIPVANYHILFMNKKASSSAAIKPPAADELLANYTAEQLRCHWLSLALDQKAVSFSPKAFDTSVSHKDKKTGVEILVKDDPRVVDPVLKESAFLTNIFNRLARSCFYGSARVCGHHLPTCAVHPEQKTAAEEVTREFERHMYAFDAHSALAAVENYARQANKWWDEASRAAKNDDAAYEQALADIFCALRTVTLLMHAATPKGCKKICECLNFEPDFFFSWEHAFADMTELAAQLGEEPKDHVIEELPPHFDFFEKHPSQKK